MRIVKALFLFLLAAYPVQATITRTQLVGNTAATASQVTVTIAATTAGHLIVAEFGARQALLTLGISDNKGNTYTQYPNVFGTNIWNGNHASTDAIWYTVDAFGGVTTVTMTNTGLPNDFGVVGEYASTNGWPINPQDVIGAVNNGTSSSWTSGTSPTTVQANELLWGALAFVAAPGAITPAAGWATGVSQTIGSDTYFMDDRVVTSIGTYTFNGTSGNSVDFGAVMVTFKDNPPPSGSKFVRLDVPPEHFDHWAITDRERTRA
jgi:hypothetical protein